jgi:3-oxoacyl-[acyl-carrier-protein] synthase II
MIKDVYIVDYVVQDHLGDNIEQNFLRMPESKGPQTISRYDTSKYPQVLCTKGYELQKPYTEKDNIGFKMSVELADQLSAKYSFLKNTAVLISSMALGYSIKDEFLQAFESHQRRFSPTKLFMANHDLLSSMIANRLKLEGLNSSTNAACSSSMFNLYWAWLMIQMDEVPAAIVGGVESPLWPNFQYYWQCTSAISTTDGGICRPFDKSRDGFVQGEGGVLFYICNEQTVKDFNLKPKAVIRGLSAGAKIHTITAHDKTGEHQGMLMEKALNQQGVRLQDISCFNAHATSTAVGDDIEYDAFAKKFVDVDIPIVAYKGYFGHTMSASGLVETAYGIEAVRNGFTPPNRELTDPCSDDPRLIINKTNLHSKTFMKASFGFGGRSAIAVIEAL